MVVFRNYNVSDLRPGDWAIPLIIILVKRSFIHKSYRRKPASLVANFVISLSYEKWKKMEIRNIYSYRNKVLSWRPNINIQVSMKEAEEVEFLVSREVTVANGNYHLSFIYLHSNGYSCFFLQTLCRRKWLFWRARRRMYYFLCDSRRRGNFSDARLHCYFLNFFEKRVEIHSSDF